MLIASKSKVVNIDCQVVVRLVRFREFDPVRLVHIARKHQLRTIPSRVEFPRLIFKPLLRLGFAYVLRCQPLVECRATFYGLESLEFMERTSIPALKL